MPGTDDWLKIATTVAPLVIGAYAGKKSKESANKASEGARLQTLLPQIQALMASQQQHSQENYGAQQQRYAMTQPLSQSILANAMSLMPRSAQGGGGMQMPSLAPQQQAPSAALPMPSVGDFTEGYKRRGGGTGGVLSGAGKGAMAGLSYGKFTGAGIVPAMAGGAVIGGIVGAAKKHAKSAPTDFAVQDAHKILTDAYTQTFGHPPSPQEIDAAVRGQGWEPGDRYVGEAGLSSVIRNWQQQARA